MTRAIHSLVEGNSDRSSIAKQYLSQVSGAEDVFVQKLIAKLALGIVPPTELNKFGHLFVNTLEFRGRDCKQLSPVRARIERSQFLLNHGQELANDRPVWFPCEVDGHAVLLVARTHP